MKLNGPTLYPLGPLVCRFLGAMHRYDAGRALPILCAAKLTTPQLAVLEFTREHYTVSAVATCLGLSQPATSQLIISSCAPRTASPPAASAAKLLSFLPKAR